MDVIERPSNGYVLSLYDQLRADIREFRREIDWRREQIALHSRELTSARVMLVQAERTLAWMLSNQADEIAELEAARARVRAILRRARMSDTSDPSPRSRAGGLELPGLES